VTLTLLSVERYREGHVLLFRLLRPRRVMRRELPWPELRLSILGAPPAFRFVPMGGGGGGGMEEMEYRLSLAIVPAPPLDGELVIEVSEIAWTRHHMSERTVVTTDPGPWRFTVPARAAG
jgi:hypothetical protein